LSKSTFTAERHKKVLTQVKKSDVRTPKTGKIKNQHYAKVSIYGNHLIADRKITRGEQRLP
jgi:hypothetical protein